MPSYELAVIFKNLARPQLTEAIKRTSVAILERGGVIRSFENIGSRTLPYKMSKDRERYNEGTYFLIHFDSPSSILLPLQDELRRDLDVIRPRVLRREEEVARPCEYGPCDFGELDDAKRRRLIAYKKHLVRKK